MKLIAAILGLLLMPALAWAEKVSVEVRHYYVPDSDVYDEWSRIENETIDAVDRRQAELDLALGAGRYEEALRAGPLPEEIQEKGDERQLDLLMPYQPELVQECIVSPGHRMAQRAWGPRKEVGTEDVMHVLVTRVGEQDVELDLVMDFSTPWRRALPYRERQAILHGLWGHAYERPLGKRFLLSEGGGNTGPPDRKGRRYYLELEIGIVRRVSDRSEDRCFPARYGPGIQVPDPNSEPPAPKAPIVTGPKTDVLPPPQDPPEGQE